MKKRRRVLKFMVFVKILDITKLITKKIKKIKIEKNKNVLPIYLVRAHPPPINAPAKFKLAKNVATGIDPATPNPRIMPKPIMHRTKQTAPRITPAKRLSA